MNNNYRLDDFFSYLHNVDQKKENAIRSCGADSFYSVQEEKRKALKSLLGIDLLEKHKCRIKVKDTAVEEIAGVTIESMGMEILNNFTMPVYVLSSQEKELAGEDGTPKAVLYIHGHGNGGCRDCFIEREPKEYHKNIPLTLARRGYKVYMFEPAGFGDFKIEQYEGDDMGGCFPISTRFLMYGMTTLGLRLYQGLRLSEYMKSDCGIKDFAIAGISGGGTLCSLFTALDDSMKAVVISCAVNLFKTSIMSIFHCVDNFIPGILEIGDMPDIISLGAPKKLFITNGKKDPIFPLDGAIEAINIIKSTYEKLGKADEFEYELFEGNHEFSEKFIDWLDVNL